METGTDQSLYHVLSGAATVLVVWWGLYALLAVLRRGRPGLAIGLPIAVAAGLRIVLAAGVSLTGVSGELRGGDEEHFIGQAAGIAATPLGSAEWISALTGELQIFVLAAQDWALGSPDFALRITEVGLAVTGLVFLATAVYELAGARAAQIAAWLIAIEPSGLFFSSLLHKESPMFLAEGIVAFGIARLWKRGDIGSLAILTFGCLVGVATRPYAGWFLIAAGAATALHAGMRTARRNELNALAVLGVVVLFIAIAAPIVLEASSDENLEQNLQASQDANAADAEANLALEQVDFSTREDVIVNLPIRVWDVTFKPYVWQLDNASQRLGALGGLFGLAVVAALIAALARSRGRIFSRAGPLVYLGFFLLVAYSLSTGNAGTGFRYRSHLLAVALCVIVTLWARSRAEAGARVAQTREPHAAPPDVPGGDGRRDPVVPPVPVH